MQKNLKPFLPIVLVFIFLNSFFVMGLSFFEKYGIDRNVLIVANIIFFIANLITLFLQQKALQNKNPNVFVRSMMASMMVKMFLVVIAMVAYIFLSGKAVNKPAIYIAIFLYLLYLVVEVAIVMKMNKNTNA